MDYTFEAYLNYTPTDEISTEGFSDIIKGIGKGILNVLKAIWSAITNAFNFLKRKLSDFIGKFKKGRAFTDEELEEMGIHTVKVDKINLNRNELNKNEVHKNDTANAVNKILQSLKEVQKDFNEDATKLQKISTVYKKDYPRLVKWINDLKTLKEGKSSSIVDEINDAIKSSKDNKNHYEMNDLPNGYNGNASYANDTTLSTNMRMIFMYGSTSDKSKIISELTNLFNLVDKMYKEMDGYYKSLNQLGSIVDSMNDGHYKILAKGLLKTPIEYFGKCSTKLNIDMKLIEADIIAGNSIK